MRGREGGREGERERMRDFCISKEPPGTGNASGDGTPSTWRKLSSWRAVCVKFAVDAAFVRRRPLALAVRICLCCADALSQRRLSAGKHAGCRLVGVVRYGGPTAKRAASLQTHHVRQGSGNCISEAVAAAARRYTKIGDIAIPGWWLLQRGAVGYDVVKQAGVQRLRERSRARRDSSLVRHDDLPHRQHPARCARDEDLLGLVQQRH